MARAWRYPNQQPMHLSEANPDNYCDCPGNNCPACYNSMPSAFPGRPCTNSDVNTHTYHRNLDQFTGDPEIQCARVFCGNCLNYWSALYPEPLTTYMPSNECAPCHDGLSWQPRPAPGPRPPSCPTPSSRSDPGHPMASSRSSGASSVYSSPGGPTGKGSAHGSPGGPQLSPSHLTAVIENATNNATNPLKRDIVELQVTIGEINARMTGQRDAIAEINARMTEQQNATADMHDKMTEQHDAIAHMNGKMTEQQDAIAEMNGKMTEQAVAIAIMNSKMTEQQKLQTEQQRLHRDELLQIHESMYHVNQSLLTSSIPRKF